MGVPGSAESEEGQGAGSTEPGQLHSLAIRSLVMSASTFSMEIAASRDAVTEQGLQAFLGQDRSHVFSPGTDLACCCYQFRSLNHYGSSMRLLTPVSGAMWPMSAWIVVLRTDVGVWRDQSMRGETQMTIAPQEPPRYRSAHLLYDGHYIVSAQC